MYYTWRHTIPAIDIAKEYLIFVAYSYLHVVAKTNAGNVNLTVREYNGAVLISTDIIFIDTTGAGIYDKIPKGTHVTIQADNDNNVLIFDIRARI
jgi:hypothetical protein